MCRSRRELSNAYLLAKFGFDTAENEPCKGCLLSAYRSLLQIAQVSRSVVVRKNKNATSGAGAGEQQPNKLDAAFQKNFGSTEAAAKLGNKVVKTTLNPTTWKNGIYFWSLMSVVVPLVLIAGYGAVKGN